MRLTRTMMVVLVALLLVGLFATPALAREGGYWTYTAGQRDDIAVSGDAADYPGGVVPTGKVFLRSDALPAGSSLMEPGDQSPHGGYVNTSAKCKVCHAVHGAGLNANNLADAPATERLLRTTVAEACSFCHITTQFAATVYDGVLANYNDPSPTNTSGSRLPGTSGHVSKHRGTGYAGCASCHSVHGANTIPGSAILKNDPAKGVTSAVAVSLLGGESGFGAFTQPVTNQRDFCQDCHNGVKRYTSAGEQTMDNQFEFRDVFPSCGSSTSCHNNIANDPATFATPGATGSVFGALASNHRTQFGVDASAARNGRSHVMTSTLTSNGTQIAWSATAVATEGVDAADNSCTTCHTSSGFPHVGPNENMIDGFTNLEHTDGVCASCHTDNGDLETATEGVGKTF